MRTGIVQVCMLYACSDWSRVSPVLYLLIKVRLCVHTYVNVREISMPQEAWLKAQTQMFVVNKDARMYIGLLCVYKLCVSCVYIYVYMALSEYLCT